MEFGPDGWATELFHHEPSAMGQSSDGRALATSELLVWLVASRHGCMLFFKMYTNNTLWQGERSNESLDWTVIVGEKNLKRTNDSEA